MKNREMPTKIIKKNRNNSESRNAPKYNSRVWLETQESALSGSVRLRPTARATSMVL